MVGVVTMDALLVQIEVAYKSRLRPSFHFVSAERARKTYSALLANLAASFALTDSTDENDDVSLVLTLRSGERSWTLYLSMVGPFAALLLPGTESSFVDENTMNADDKTRAILAAVARFGLHVLPEDMLRQRTDFRLHDDEECATVFQAMFSEFEP